ncbi:MAG: alpha-galactosidase [Treponema sp.]|jgi:alpha-galactosidase|nr:alpha-galactosidase [Treponema sp.]
MQKSETFFSNDGFPSMRYVSGNVIYDEAFLDGRLLSRYWTDTGQIVPESCLLPDKLRRDSADFPIDAFELTVNGKKLDRFEYILSGEKECSPETDPTGLRSQGRLWYVRLRSPEGIEVDVNTRLDGSPFIVRWLDISNKSAAPAGITSVYPLAGRVWAFNAGNPELAGVIGGQAESSFSVAYNHSFDYGHEGDFYFDQLKGKEFRFDGGRTGISGYSRPAFWLRNRCSGKTLVCELAYSSNWEFRIRTSSVNNTEQAGFAIGLPETAGEYCRVLDPGESASTPLVHAGYFSGDDDSIVQAAHAYMRHTVMPKPPEGKEVEVETWHLGYLGGRETGERIKENMDAAAVIGTEMYILDAGWFGEPPNVWYHNGGDWYAGPWMGCSIKSLSDYAHSKGMRFGLWFAVEGTGPNSKLRREHPEWLMTRNGEKTQPWEGILNLTRDDVVNWIEKDVIERSINEYGLDLFRIDAGSCVGLGANRERSGLKENMMWRYCDNLYGIFDRVVKKYPQVVFQNCSSGGGRLDYGMLRRFHNTEMSDWSSPPRVIKMYSGISMAIPPERILCFCGAVGWGMDEPGLDFQLRRVSVCLPRINSIAPSLAELPEPLLSAINEKMGLYKKVLRPILKDCKMYIHTPFQPILKDADFAVFEYAEKTGKRSFAAFFRLNMDKKEDYFFKPRSLNEDARYKVYFDNSGKSAEVSGFDLASRGFLVKFHSSQLIIFEELG